MDCEYGAPLQVAEIKASGDSYEVAGYVSTYGNVDEGDDIVVPGAFDASIASGRKVRFLYGHRLDLLPLGTTRELKSDDRGLFGTFKLSKTQLGQDVHTALKDGSLDSFSIGYVPTQSEYDDVGHRLLKSVDLLEVSLVTLPMNPRAMVTRVKQRDLQLDQQVPFEDLLAQIKGFLMLGADEAESLERRRASEQRKLSDAHSAAIETLLAEAKACAERLERLLEVPAEAKAEQVDLKLRLVLARRLKERRAQLVEVG